MSKLYVQHFSGQGLKWELRDVGHNKYDAPDWLVIRPNGDGHPDWLYLPRSEYRPCEPPERWVDVTGECTVNKYGGIQHNGVNTMADQGYRRSKVPICTGDGYKHEPTKQWAFIVEKKVK